MKYNILVIPDIHWGVMDPDKQLKELEFIFEILECSSMLHIDLVVIAGDYFDSKLPLNSREALISLEWMKKLFDACVCSNVQRIRMFKGTMDHDNDQLQVFEYLKDEWDDQAPATMDEDYFKIFYKTTVEETLPGLKCIYCPDELLTTEDYEEVYMNEMLSINDIGFFHGSFDVVYGELLAAKPDMWKKKNVIYRYEVWNKLINGPLIAGHWHDGKSYDNLHYCGSPCRYKFNEDEPKGVGFISYDTEEKSYFYKKILNPLASEYKTFEIYTNLCQSKEAYTKIISQINDSLMFLEKNNHISSKLRIMIHINDDKVENDNFISALRQHFIDNKNVKIVLKNKLKEKIKKDSVKKNKERQKKFDFIYSKNKDASEIIYDFIKANNAESDIPIDYIKEKVKQYMKG